MELQNVNFQRNKESFDLLKLVEEGGCSAKLPAAELAKVLKDLPKPKDKNLLVDIETHDDAGIYKIRDDYALVLTTDFFPPVCSDPYEFGQIAAANALSDIYAMGGEVLTALNLVQFPADVPMTVLQEILRGGQNKVEEAKAVIVGGHTIENTIPTYGLALTGWVHPDRFITNDRAKAGDLLILTKPLGTGAIIAAQRLKLCDTQTYQKAVDTMKQLNNNGAEIMRKYNIKCATDITGFGLVGHALKMAVGSHVSIRIHSRQVPAIDKVIDLLDLGVIPGAAFRNLEFTKEQCLYEDTLDYNYKMLLLDAQTSGGLLICVAPNHAQEMLYDLQHSKHPEANIIGEVVEQGEKALIID